MRDRIRELSEGRVEYQRPVLKVYPDIIDVELEIDGLHRYVIMVESEGFAPVKGVVYSSHSRVAVLNMSFYGKTNNIGLEVNTLGLNPGAIISGDITLVTNAGEKNISYKFNVKEKIYGEGERQLVSMDDFSEFAHEDPKGALSLFKSRAFVKLPFMQDMNTLAIYQVLMNEKDGRRNMEAFLTYHEAKDAVSFSLPETTEKVTEGASPVKRSFVVKQDNWGYGVIMLSCKNPFIALSNETITSDDFDENGICSCTYTLFPGAAKNEEGTVDIILSTARAELVYSLDIQKNCQDKKAANEEKQQNIQLMNYVVDYRIAKIKGGDRNTTRVKKCLGILIAYLEELVEKDPGDWQRKLLLIYYYMIGERIEDADKYLDEVRDEVMKNRLGNVRAYCFFLYLRAVFYNSAEQLDTASKLINKYYIENGQDPALMLLLLRCDTTFTENPSLKILKLKELYNAGCTSPLMYLEVCESYRKSPDLLRVLNDFERQAMFFGARKKLLSEDMAVEIAKLCAYENIYKPSTYRLLVNTFEMHPIQVVLENLCGYLIRTGCRGEEHFKWFELGVKSGITLLGINEAYIESLPSDYNKPLPREILLYFAYSQDLRADVKELLYSNILEYSEEDVRIYEEYKEQMEEYALGQLIEGRFSRRLLPLYKKLLDGDMIDERLAKVLPELLMTYEIRCSNKNMRKVVIRCPELNYEDSYSLSKGSCCAPVYTDDCLLFFVDGYGNRYSDMAYEKEILFEDKKYLQACEKKYPDYLMFLLRKSKELLTHPMKDADEIDVMNRILASADVSKYYKLRIMSRMLQYSITKKIPVNDELLMNIDLKAMSDLDRKKALICMVTNRHYNEVYEYIYKNGLSGLRPETLLLIAESRIQRIKNAEESYLVSLCKYLFDQNRFSVQTLTYLCSHYQGPDAQMKKILFAADKSNAMFGDMPERLLGQMLFAEECEKIAEVFALYKKNGNVSRPMVRAYEVFCCYQYFVCGNTIDISVFDMVYSDLFAEDTLDITRKETEKVDIISIALLYYLTKTNDVIKNQLEICEILLKRLCQKGILLGFYTMLWSRISFPEELNGKVLLEHRSKGCQRAYCTYGIMGSDEKTTVMMQKMYDGVFVTQLILFADETLEYSIIEENYDGEKLAVERELLSNDMSFVREGSSFDTINSFSRMFASGRINELEEALISYEKKQYVIDSLFAPI